MDLDDEYLRVAHPIELWDGSGTAADSVGALRDDAHWSLFKLTSGPSPHDVLAAFYGWRRGRGPVVGAGYHVFTGAELATTGGTLTSTPDEYDWPWPGNVRAAHHDLAGHTESGIVAFVGAITPLGPRLHWVTRIDLVVGQVRLANSPDAPAEFKERVRERLTKLRTNEPHVHHDLHERLRAAGLVEH